MGEEGKGCSEKKERYLFMNSNMDKAGKYDQSIYLFYNITTYTIIFNLVFNFSVG